eukprot:8207034-Lingulodinium_polyedra.AAC.1
MHCMPCPAMPCPAMPCHALPRRPCVPGPAMPCHAMPCYACMPQYVPATSLSMALVWFGLQCCKMCLQHA